ncbi:MAG: restriction endonuclease [Treponema sp.]|nr:restriction endonuclease [Treponema sp.]
MPSTVQSAFDSVISKYRTESFSERDKGDRFEKLIKAYLLTKPEYKTQLSDVWLWSDFPYKDQFGTGGKDTGIDIVCRTYDGEYWAVQCKCYQENKKVDLATVSTFITTSQFPFIIDGEQKTFSHRIWIDTTINGFNLEALRKVCYRPFSIQDVYFDRVLNEYVYVNPYLFPTSKHKNLVICTQ